MLLMRTTKTAICLQPEAIFHHLYVFNVFFIFIFFYIASPFELPLWVLFGFLAKFHA